MTADGLIAGIIIGFFVGIPIGLMYSTTFEKMRSKIISIIACMIIFFCIAGFGFTNQELIFNNGTYSRCDTKEAVANKTEIHTMNAQNTITEHGIDIKKPDYDWRKM